MKLSEVAKTELLSHPGISLFEWVEYNHLEIEFEAIGGGHYAVLLKKNGANAELRCGSCLQSPCGWSSRVLPDKHGNLSKLNRAIRSLADAIEGQELIVSYFKTRLVEMIHVPPKLRTPWLKAR